MGEDSVKKVTDQMNYMVDEYGKLIFELIETVLVDTKEDYTKRLNYAIWDGNYKRSLKLTGSIKAVEDLHKQLLEIKSEVISS